MTTASRVRQRQYRERQYEAGKHFVRGRLVDTPRVKRSPGEEPPHGTTERYRWRQDPCSCDLCRAANAAATRERRKKLREGA